MPRIVETRGEVLFKRVRETFNYAVYEHRDGPRAFRIYLDRERSAGLQRFKAIVAVEAGVVETINHAPVANAMHNQIVENQLTENNSRLQVITELLTGIKDAVTPKPKRRYVRKSPTKRRVRK